MEFLGTLVIILIATSLFGHLASRVGIPAVIGQLFVGIILGPVLLNWVHANDFIHIFSEIGVIILMFIAGLESDCQWRCKNVGLWRLENVGFRRSIGTLQTV